MFRHLSAETVAQAAPRVLIVDDDPLIRTLLRQCLEYGGYEVVDAHNGGDAIERLEQGETYDVVVTDFNMPVASGIDVIRTAHRLHPNLPCVIVTAFRDMDLAMEAMSEGAVGFIPKPFKPGHLLTVVHRARERGDLAVEAVHLRLLAPMLERFTMLLANTVEAKDAATQQHCERLVASSGYIAAGLGLNERQTEAVRLGAALHDIGKISVPDELLRKPDRLTDEEMERMRRHPEVGAAILENIEAWHDVRLVVRHHHEHYDGSGYPDGLAGPDIPIGARIVAVADAFDVMRRGRRYAAPKPFEVIIEELRRLRGRQFDPDCVDVFLAMVEQHDRDLELLQQESPTFALEHLLAEVGQEPAPPASRRVTGHRQGYAARRFRGPAAHHLDRRLPGQPGMPPAHRHSPEDA